MEIKFIRNIVNEVADIYIYDEIGQGGLTGGQFLQEFKWLEQNDSITRINVRINSGGGAVIDGGSMMSIIRNSKKEVHTYNDFMALSSAGWVFLGADKGKRHMSSIAKLMIHDPSFGDEAKLSEKEKRALLAVKDTLVSIFEASGDKTKDEISSLMTDETWIDSQEAVDWGLINTENIEQFDKALTASYNALPCEVVNFKINNNNKKEKQMENLINKLGLSDGAEEKDFINKFEEMQNKIDGLEAEKETMTQDNEELQKDLETVNSEKETLQNEIETLKEVENKTRLEVVNGIIDKAVEAGKIKEDAKENLAKTFENNVEGLKAVIDSLNTQSPGKITNEINTNEKESGKEAWTMRDWEKNDPDGLAVMQNENPKKFERLYNEFYKK